MRFLFILLVCSCSQFAFASQSGWTFGLGASYNSSAKLRFGMITVSNAVGFAQMELNYQNVASLEIEARKAASNSWGFMGGATYDLERNATHGKVTASGTTTYFTAVDDPSKLKVTVVYANAVSRWDNFYIPFGLNYSFIKLTPSASSTEDFTVSGGLGAQWGLGYYFSDNFVVEGFSRAAAVKIESTSTSGVKTDYGPGFLSSLLLTAKVLF